MVSKQKLEIICDFGLNLISGVQISGAAGGDWWDCISPQNWGFNSINDWLGKKVGNYPAETSRLILWSQRSVKENA